jgi:hypothetical protein
MCLCCDYYRRYLGKLLLQCDTMADAMFSCLLAICQYSSADAADQAITFWTRLATHKSLCVSASEWFKAASIALTLMAVSVEDERLFYRFWHL